MGWMILLVVIVVVVLLGLRSAKHSYTMGSNLFKDSDNNLEKDKHQDVSDYEYYNDKDILK